MLGLLTRANAIHCRARGLSLIAPDDGISGGEAFAGLTQETGILGRLASPILTIVFLLYLLITSELL